MNKTEADRERIEFIRRAAIALWSVKSTRNWEDESSRANERKAIKRAWYEAKALWDARPEDC